MLGQGDSTKAKGSTLLRSELRAHIYGVGPVDLLASAPAELSDDHVFVPRIFLVTFFLGD
jgi:hypothetical protein